MIDGKPCVAVVDDEETVRRSVARLLRSSGLHSEAFASAAEFLAAGPLDQCDCLVLDLHMPAMDGFELHAEIRRRGLRIPVVILTGHDKPEHRAQAMEAGVAAYLVKPVDEQVLLAAIVSAVPGAVWRPEPK